MTAEMFKFAPGYALPTFPFTPPPELLHGVRRRRYPVVIVGGGLSGLTLACDLSARGVHAVVLDEDDTIGARGASSRGIVYGQKSLEIFDRLGIYERIRGKGVIWSVGKTLSGGEVVYSFNRHTTSVHKQPAFINIQQFYLEWFLVDRIKELGNADLRWKNKVVDVALAPDHAVLSVETPDGPYRLEASYVVDATGANSPIREGLGLESHPSRSPDRWCITDVRFKKQLPMERWTWVDAPFNEGRGVWQHPMADDVWRMDYQMSPDADPDAVSLPQVAGERLRAQLGADCDLEFVWIGPYTYRDHLMDTFRHGPVFFIGDAAHVVSPFGARGGNNGIQDAANLGWKLALVLQGKAGDRLLDSYSAERRPAAAENLRITSASARFMAPRSLAERVLRKALIALARRYEFAQSMINTGRMCVANNYPPAPCLPEGGFSVPNMSITLADGSPGSVVDLLREGTRLVGLWMNPDSDQLHGVPTLEQRWPLAVYALEGSQAAACRPLSAQQGRGWTECRRITDSEGRLAEHLGAAPGTFCLLRPDAYCTARIVSARPAAIEQAIRAALGDVQSESTDPSIPSNART